MPVCRTCSTQGEEHHCSKVTTKFAGGTSFIPKDSCEHCDPSFVQDRIHMPVEQKLWLMCDVNPNEYEMVDGVRKMKDWADDEFGQRLAAPDQDDVRAAHEAKEKKRARAREGRKRPLTQHEIRVADERMREAMKTPEGTILQ